MELILTEDIQTLGKAGELVKVRDGYGRNYLLPQKKAMLANSKNLKVVEQQKKMIEAKKAKNLKFAEELKSKFENLEITIQADVGSEDRLFGSITKIDIATALQKQGIHIDRHAIELATPIKAIGAYDISAKIHPEVSTSFKLWVIRRT